MTPVYASLAAFVLSGCLAAACAAVLAGLMLRRMRGTRLLPRPGPYRRPWIFHRRGRPPGRLRRWVGRHRPAGARELVLYVKLFAALTFVLTVVLFGGVLNPLAFAILD